MLCGNSMNALFKFIRRKTKVRSAVPNLQANSDAFQSDATKAGIFNDFFGSVYTRDSGGTAELPDREFHLVLGSVDITQVTVLKVLSKMPSKLSCGPDGIPSILYKQCKNVLALPLAILSSRSLGTGEIPEILKRTVVVPVFNKLPL